MALKNKKFYGIKFRCHDDAGIAKINIYNTSNQYIMYGDTHTNTTIDGIASTANLSAGMLVEGTGVATNTKIVSVDSTTAITVDKATTASATVTLTFTQCDLSNKLVDLFQKDFDDTNGVYEEYIFWATLSPATDSFEIIVEHNGTYNINAVGPDYSMEIDNYYTQEELALPSNNCTLTIYHEDYPGETHSYSLAEDTTTYLYKRAYFSGDDLTDTFVLSGTNRASEFIQVSVDGGTTWLTPNYIGLTWGSNAPDYDDETLSTSTGYVGYMGVKFYTPPTTGTNNVIIEFNPMSTDAYISSTMALPSDGSDYVNYAAEVRVLSQILEIR